MNKNVLISNLMRIRTNIEKTIATLNSMTLKEPIYSKEQIEKNLNILKVKIEDDDNYKTVSTEYFLLKLMLKNINQTEFNYKNLIESLNSSLIPLHSKSNEIKTIISEEQRELEVLANSLDISFNDEQLYKLIQAKNNKILKLQDDLRELEKDIKEKKEEIDFYVGKIARLSSKKEKHQTDLSLLDEYDFSLESKNSDMIKLEMFEKLSEILSSLKVLNSILNKLDEAIEYINLREASIDVVNEKIENIKQLFEKLNSDLLRFIKTINISYYIDMKNRISKRLSNNESYLLSEDERSKNEKEISRLELAISLLQNDGTTDEAIADYYGARAIYLEDEYHIETINNKVLQNKINQLKLTKSYFISDSTQLQNDLIDKEIKLQTRKSTSEKTFERLIGYKFDIKDAVKTIKKVRKDSDTLKGYLQDRLEQRKEMIANNSTSRYSLDEDKKDLLFIDFVVQIFEFVKQIMNKKYIQKLDEVEEETYDPFVEVIDFVDFDNVPILYTDEFVENVRKAMDRMITYGNLDHKNDLFIKFLNSEGVTVSRYGKSLKTMEQQIEQTKEKVLQGE